jgi:hypothetical protein
MLAKTIEIRDKATFIPALAIRLKPTNGADLYLLARAGYSTTPERQAEYVLLMDIRGGEGRVNCDPECWGGRTWPVAHRWLIEHFDEIQSGAVVDVEFILGESAAPKVTEAVLWP